MRRCGGAPWASCGWRGWKWTGRAGTRAERRQRVPLPTYPFDRQRFWLQPSARALRHQAAQANLEATVDALKREELSDWFYLPGWKHSAPQLASSGNGLRDTERCWLLFQDACGVSAHIAEWLARDHQDVVLVQAGRRFDKLTERLYTLNPRMPADYAALLKDLRARGKTPHERAHFWTVTTDTPAELGHDCLEKMLDIGFYSLLYLTQALNEHGVEACRISVISNGIQQVTGNEQLCPQKATLIGPCKVIPLEYANIRCRSIDITLPAATSWQFEELMNLLAASLPPSRPRAWSRCAATSAGCRASSRSS